MSIHLSYWDTPGSPQKEGKKMIVINAKPARSEFKAPKYVKQVGNTWVELTLADCPDDGGKYQLLCRNHGYLIQDNNKSRLWKFASEVTEWCAACQGTDPRYNK
jgi:hypothetical protein